MMRPSHRTRYRKPAAGLILSGMLLAGAAQGPAVAQEQELNGSAYGAYASVSLFGGPPTQVGAAPAVVLPPTGGAQAASLPELIGQFGPATIIGGQFEDPGRNPTGELTASTEGETGPDGFVTSAAAVVNVGPGPFIADDVSSACTSDADGVTGSTTITNGIVETSYDLDTQEAVTSEDVPESPPPNTAIEGTIDHVGDSFRVVFNEQIIDGDTITVRAVHVYLLGQIAVGDLIMGESVCGLSAGDGSTTPSTLEPLPVDQPADATTTTEATEAEGDETTTSETQETDGTDLSADAASADSDDDGGAPVVPILLAVVVALGLAGLFVVKRRGSPPTGTT